MGMGFRVCCRTGRLETTISVDIMQREELNTETAKIPWKELEKFFANGTTIYVSPDLDLIDVALEVCRDNKAQMEQWMAEEKVGEVSEGHAI